MSSVQAGVAGANNEVAKFGSVLGYAPGGISVHSCDYNSADREDLPNRHAYRSYVDGIFMGYKWQCVELARRWLYINKGYIFDEISMAYDIFRLKTVRRISDDTLLPLQSFRNGARRPPEPGCLLIWNEGGEFDVTGHVAVVTEVEPHCVRFVEQNVHNHIWPEGRGYSREIKATSTADGGYWLECTFSDTTLLGWVIQTADETHAEKMIDPDPQLFDLQQCLLPDQGQAKRPWLDLMQPDEAAYVASRGYRLASRDAEQYLYFSLSETAQKELKRATNELHALFMHATDYVLQDDALLEKFNLPRALWPKIHASWDNRRHHMITGRFDFAVSARGVKVYEYNADSASCYMEAGKVQGLWAQHFGCRQGVDAAAQLGEALVDAWAESAVDDVLHIMQDNNQEENYHALYMKSAMEKAGIRCKVIKGVAGLQWHENGEILDAEGIPIKWVWKTWAWETALDQIRAECEDDEEKLRNYSRFNVKPGEMRTEPPRLVDVLLRKEVMVFEPLWTLIPSNKAILPVLWLLFPRHPYLLESHFELNDTLRANGYVSKPIAGRCGDNISLFDRDNSLLAGTDGRFDHQNHIYQQLWKLPQVGDYRLQVCSFSVDGVYAGACVRADPSLVITTDSDVIPLRILEDEIVAAKANAE